MAVVVSAMGGKPKVTDLLLNSVSLAAAGDRAGSEVRSFICCCESLLRYPATLSRTHRAQLDVVGCLFAIFR